jgi:hypothetical protein
MVNVIRKIVHPWTEKDDEKEIGHYLRMKRLLEFSMLIRFHDRLSPFDQYYSGHKDKEMLHHKQLLLY